MQVISKKSREEMTRALNNQELPFIIQGSNGFQRQIMITSAEYLDSDGLFSWERVKAAVVARMEKYAKQQ